MKILFLGDIAGSPGRSAVKKLLPKVIEEHQPDLVIANGENGTHGDGLNDDHTKEMLQAGIHVFTGGNHSFWSRDHVAVLNQSDPVAIRPANYPQGVPGKGWKVIDTGLKKVAVINLQGRAFMKDHVLCPFKTLDKIIMEELIGEYIDHIFIDFHAETTSEKNCMLYYCERHENVRAIVGTHTHVQTNDARIGPTGIGYLTDAGMCGAYRSIIGVKVEPIIKRMLLQTPQRKEFSEEGGLQFNGVLFTIEGKSCTDVKPINIVDLN